MKIEIELKNIKPISLNNSQKITTVRGKPRKYKTDAAKEFEFKTRTALNRYLSEIEEFNSFYDEKKHYLEVDYVWHIPVFTKKKTIGKNSGDVDNLIKNLNDLIFKQLNADDSAIMSITSTKIHSEALCIKIVMQIKNLSDIL